MEQPTCEERIDKDMEETLNDLRLMWDSYPEAPNDDLPPFDEYGLSFDYVAPGTFASQSQGYFRYQLSWGGPSTEFRFFVNPDLSPYMVEYWFLDWWDGASRTLHGDAEDLLLTIYNDLFKECGLVQARLDEAKEG